MTRRLSVTLWFAVAIVATALAATTGNAAPDPKDLVKAELLSDASTVKPGEPFTVGVALKLAPTWHVYWTNPGETGLPTKTEFKLPAGWTAGPVRYPVPKEFVQPGDIAGYGYEDEVVLLATLTPAKDAAVGATETIAARVSWLVCDPNQCIPGRADVSTTVAVADAPAPNAAHAAALKPWVDRVPVEPGRSRDVARVEWKPSGDGEITGTVDWTGDARDAKLFPGEDDALELTDIKVEPAGQRKSRIALRVRRLAGQAPKADALPSVLAYTNGAGERRGVEVSIPLPPSALNAQARRNE